MGVIFGVVISNIIHITPPIKYTYLQRLMMTLYGMLDYGQGFNPLLGVKITPVFLSVYFKHNVH